MAHLKTVRDPDLSLWQSAVDEVVAKRTAATHVLSEGVESAVQRPDPGGQMVQGAATDVTAEAQSEPLSSPVAAGPAATPAAEDFAQFCSTMARKLAMARIEGNAADATAAALQFSQFQQCDPGWLEVVAKYEEFQVAATLNHATIPYITYKTIDDFVMDGRLPDPATVAIVGDWGTGEDAAQEVLAQIARKKPDVVIHLGDIYYSGTDFEVQNYFLKIWNQYFDTTKTPTFTLSGNHDMYSGGAPYYTLLETLGQPASYCCIRNNFWQFVMIDTGINDRTPIGSAPTFLQNTEVPWIEERIAQAGGRKTVLLSHHQLFTRFSNIVDPPPSGQAGLAINENLQQQLGNVIPQLTLWIWGHEHDMVIYDKQQGVLARCLGNGAIPVLPPEGPGPQQPEHPEITADDTIRPVLNGEFLTHGYAIMVLNGPNATVSYYMDNDEVNPVKIDNL